MWPHDEIPGAATPAASVYNSSMGQGAAVGVRKSQDERGPHGNSEWPRRLGVGSFWFRRRLSELTSWLWADKDQSTSCTTLPS